MLCNGSYQHAGQHESVSFVTCSNKTDNVMGQWLEKVRKKKKFSSDRVTVAQDLVLKLMPFPFMRNANGFTHTKEISRQLWQLVLS